MIARLVTRLVALAYRHAAAVAIAALVLTLGAGYYAATHLDLDTDIEQLLPRDTTWRQQEIALDQAFPQNADLLVVVVDGETPEATDAAASALAQHLKAEPNLFHAVRQPDGGPFFARNGLLFLPPGDLADVTRQLIAAQPVIGSLAADPSLRGLFAALTLFIQGVQRGDVALAKLDPTLTKLAAAIDAILARRPATLSWGELLTGQKPDRHQLRKFVLTQPVLDYSALEPGARASKEIRRLVAELKLTPANGLTVRITGPVALGDEQFATLRQGALRSTVFSLVSVCVLLFAALRSARLVAAILGTLISGAVLTAAFAALAIGRLNLISVAFAVLFIGLAVDFGIQFGIRYRDQRFRRQRLDSALTGAAETIGPALVLAAGATAIGFFSFVPTPYVGVRELGWIAGAGMVIAILLNFTLLPALLTLLRPRAEREPVGFAWAAPIDQALLRHRRLVSVVVLVVAIIAIALLPRVSFDFNPLNLKDPHSESVSTVFDLMKDPDTSPYTAEILAPSLADADALARRLEKLPEIAQAITASSYIPTDQEAKLAAIGDVSLLLGPTLSPPRTLPPPSDDAVIAAMRDCHAALVAVMTSSAAPDAAATALTHALDAAVNEGPSIVAPLQASLLAGLRPQLALLAQLIQAQPISLATLPDDLRADWVTPDGRARIEVFPKGDARDNAVLERFVAAIRTVAPNATGTPVTIQESGRLISHAFVEAGIIAVAAITLLLAAILRRVRDVALVFAPLLLAAILTLATTVLLKMPLNYANIIALPLLLGIGVAFDIYFVMNWRRGVSLHLQSSTARAVIFSAFTTLAAFGSLALSKDPGTADMGKLLSISLAWTLICTLFALPALLGPAKREK
ncbi:MAG TPA: MMPL family transporter [Stellaceae bacterium]|nr:MMPL family transporter [Stellaceae bacterium]